VERHPRLEARRERHAVHCREFLGHGWIDRLTKFHLVFPPSLLLKHELDGVLTHPGCKPRTAVFPQHRSVQLGMFSNMLKELDPDLWWVLRLTLTSIFAEGLHILSKFIGCVLKDLRHQIVFILIMAVERGSVDHGPFGNIAHGDGIEPLLGNQFNHCFL